MRHRCPGVGARGLALSTLMLVSAIGTTFAADPGRSNPSNFPLSGPVVLTGSIRALEAEFLGAPVTSNWQLTLTWLIEEGQTVAAGDSVGLLDPAGLEGRLLDAEDRLSGYLQSRVSREAQAKIDRMGLEIAEKRADIEFRKSRLDAAVPQAVLDGRGYRARQLEQSRRQQALQDAQLDLREHDAVTRSELAETDINISETRAEVQRLETELQSLNLRASGGGIVVHEVHPWFGRKIQVGDRIQATLPIVRIPDLSTLEVEAWAGEIDASRLHVDQTVTLTLDAAPDRQYRGRILAVSSAGERRESWGRSPYLRVRISIDDPDGEIMRPGMSVRCEVEERS